MKFLIALLLMTQFSFASSTKREEFDPKDEDKCFVEMQKLGCGNSKEVSPTCVEARKKRLTSKCRYIHEKRKVPH